MQYVSIINKKKTIPEIRLRQNLQIGLSHGKNHGRADVNSWGKT